MLGHTLYNSRDKFIGFSQNLGWRNIHRYVYRHNMVRGGSYHQRVWKSGNYFAAYLGYLRRGI